VKLRELYRQFANALISISIASQTVCSFTFKGYAASSSTVKTDFAVASLSSPTAISTAGERIGNVNGVGVISASI
jgi:hypothetical protein